MVRLHAMSSKLDELQHLDFHFLIGFNLFYMLKEEKEKKSCVIVNL